MSKLAPILLAVILAACGGPVGPSGVDVRVAATNPRFADNDPHDWTDVHPARYAVHGIDVSKYQGEVDWKKAQRSGVAFAFIKATEGGDRVDDRFKENWAAARRAGVARGAYHFFYFCRPAIEQARWFMRHVPRESGSLPPVLDMEWNHKSPTCAHYRPEAKVVREEMKVFLDRTEKHYGRRPLIYTTVDFYHENELWRLKGEQFWLRSVAGHPSTVYPDRDWTFWQYTGTGVVPGVSGDADINAFRGSVPDWQRWLEANAL